MVVAIDDFDKVERLEQGSLIQHGSYNDRLYLMKMSRDAPNNLPQRLISKAEKNGYSKIFGKIASKRIAPFVENGFTVEALIPDLYNGLEMGLLVAYYLDDERSDETDLDKYESIKEMALDKREEEDDVLPLKNRFSVRRCNKSDVSEMVEIYKKVFASYPFPIHDPDYLIDSMENDVDYFAVEEDGKIIALSSAEMDKKSANVEMTDFATLPDCRGNNLSLHLLDAMEREVKKEGIRTAYTIARAASPGMNITFSRSGYKFGGRLKNNTNISGNIESMNVWYKELKL